MSVGSTCVVIDLDCWRFISYKNVFKNKKTKKCEHSRLLLIIYLLFIIICPLGEFVTQRFVFFRRRYVSWNQWMRCIACGDFLMYKKKKLAEKYLIFRLPEAKLAAEVRCTDSSLVSDALSKFQPGFQALCTQLRVE